MILPVEDTPVLKRERTASSAASLEKEKLESKDEDSEKARVAVEQVSVSEADDETDSIAEVIVKAEDVAVQVKRVFSTTCCGLSSLLISCRSFQRKMTPPCPSSRSERCFSGSA